MGGGKKKSLLLTSCCVVQYENMAFLINWQNCAGKQVPFVYRSYRFWLLYQSHLHAKLL